MPDQPTIPTAGSIGAGEPAAALWIATVLYSPARGVVGRDFVVVDHASIGRSDGSELDIMIDDGKMSRRHATLRRKGFVLELRDDGSSNGTFVNGDRIASEVTLGPEDIVRMGNTLLVIHARVDTGSTPSTGSLTGRAARFLDAVTQAARVACASLPVLLLGETGTGKDELARYVHGASKRSGAYVAVNCATLPGELAESTLFGHRKGAFTGAASDAEGLFAQAQGGTIFLDEIGELPLQQQPKLLRVLENREYLPVGSTKVMRTDARVIAATHVDLAAAVAAGRFREDLYARLAGAIIRLPPLRDRRRDILELAERFLADLAPDAPFALSVHAAERLLLHRWPRNIRELRTAMQRLALAQPGGGEVTLRAIESVLDEPSPAPSTTTAAPRTPAATAQAPSRDELRTRLVATRGNVNRMAEHYGKDPKQVYRWLKRHDLDPDDYR